MRQPDLGPPLVETPERMPLGVAERGLGGWSAADGRAWAFDVRPDIKEDVDQLDVVVAGGPVQGGFVVTGGERLGIDIGSRLDEGADDGRGVWSMSGGVGVEVEGPT